MPKFLKVAGLLAACVIGGCMEMPYLPPGMAAQTCSAGGDCHINVRVLCDVYACNPDAPDEVSVDRTGLAPAAPATLYWHVPNLAILRDVYFTNRGIAFADGRFDCAIADHGKTFRCVDHAPVGRYKYTITLEWHDNVLTIAPKDPWVVNR